MPADVDFQARTFDYVPHADQRAAAPVRRPVVIVGAGPVGLALAIDLAQRGIPVTVLDNDNRLSTGSRAICFAKRTLEIFDRLGCGDRVVAKGVSWSVGKVFLRDEQVWRFDLLPEAGHERPAFVNLQQYYVEGYLAERAAQLPLVDLRWRNEVVATQPHGDHVALTIATPDGQYRLEADHVVACDGSRSAVRRHLGLESKGRTFRDRFLIADVRMAVDAPAERWFWFDPPFHPDQSVLLHRQPDGVWRIDFQLGWDADPEHEKKPENIIPRVKALLAHSPAMKDAGFTLEWASVYTFACMRMDSFRHGRVLFAGDAAHGVSPFGARGANSGVQDADNLGWKLAAVLQRRAPDALLDTYAREREAAADENIRHSTHATDFITPKSAVSRLFRDAVLALARTQPFARTLVNSGRLSTPTTLHGSPLNTPDAQPWAGTMVPGAAAADARVTRADGRDDWLLRQLGDGFTALVGHDPAIERALQDVHVGGFALKILAIGGDLIDTDGDVARRYDLRPGSVVLLRPDAHVCARWREPTRGQVEAALRRALAAKPEPLPCP
ncbi:FAD-dependent oxidoreductase [Scleromatobacter humisilvae]|uniref:FAD-dependent oxidoreductase n=1 Tax=Scleromatobacter humisilvae TaxID=2897159 RepID=A0A9X1YIJ1_9BURK|nr:FAD-dependent oxidoreductase [Scleromatobacter humisilvae]MCK9686969.1 FAD-dependent oxidoreductase [Scleromatobacter humisilvae]